MDVTYVGKSEGDYFDLFHFLADGDRPVLEVLVDPYDQIWICGVTGLSIPQVTLGKTHRHSIVDGVEPVICLKSVATYVVPRIATLMARVYCPAKPADLLSGHTNNEL